MALYDFEAKEEDELSLGEGNEITVLQRPDGDWWLGSDGSRVREEHERRKKGEGYNREHMCKGVCVRV